MIVASIRNGFQPHQVGLRGLGLGCAGCNGTCKNGLGFCGDGEAATCPFAAQLYSTSLNPAVPNNPNPIYAVGSPQWNEITQGAVSVSSNLNELILSSPANSQPSPIFANTSTNSDAAQITVPVNTPAVQVAQQQTQSNGIVATPVVAPVVVAATTNDNSLTSLLESTFLGIPIWMIGIGLGAFAFMESEK